MLFSSNIFLFLFLPLVFLVYFSINKLFRSVFLNNLVLVISSLLFYFWGSGKYTLLFFASIFINYFLGLLVHRSSKRKFLLAIGIIFNISLLSYYKYFSFFYSQLSSALNKSSWAPLPEIGPIFLPIGISFYTFMMISYLVDVYRKNHPPTNFLNFSTYITLFPHLVAGPIVRFSQIKKEIKKRHVSADLFFEGLWYFSLGLGKKVILADNLGLVADKIFSLAGNELSAPLAWLGVVSYAFQIYFDFSGYSEMAIGLAKFFGFNFPLNFNFPYISKSITEFWRRWHITLSSWFKDYLYIPLGGNRRKPARVYFNLATVFTLCGFWHGASWTFVVWGLYHGLLLVIEKVLKNKFNFETRGFPGVALSFFLVLIGWVFFRSTSIGFAFNYLAVMFGFIKNNAQQCFALGHYLNRGTIFFLFLSAVLSFTFVEKCKLLNNVFLKGLASLLLLLYSFILLSRAQFNPFIYFQF